ncbi:hypothetical protein [Gymnodinialimonas sp.]
MKTALLTTALIAALGTSAMAQGIQPVTNAPATDVTVGTLEAENGILIALLAAAAIIASVASSSDGSN